MIMAVSPEAPTSYLRLLVAKISKSYWNWHFVLCMVHLILMCITVPVHAQETVDLYTDGDHVLNLKQSEIDSELFGKEHIFIVEFYNSWCGYCIGFAPTWKAFARDVKDWKAVAQVAAVNCAQEENVQLCRDYKVEKYPSIRYFWTNIEPRDIGENANHSYIVREIRSQWLDYIHTHWKVGVPKHWPNLEPVTATSLKDIWNSVPSSTSNVTLIVEKEDSYIAREVILDLSAYAVTILRIVNTNSDLIRELKEKVDLSFPSVFNLKRNGSIQTLSGSSNSPRESFRNTIETEILGMKPEVETMSSVTETNRVTPPIVPSAEIPVHMVDLENTLHYALKQEAVLQEYIEGERLDALKSFVQLLSSYFPGRKPVKRFLRDLYLHLSIKKTKRLSAKQLTDMMNNLESSESVLPPMEEWMSCRGSSAKYRGYSCGLWTLFHVLSVEAFQQPGRRDQNVGANLLEKVLIPIRGYVLNFFSCTDCAKNFGIESAALETDVKFPNDTVLWLWWTHNGVNKRIAGESSEDPQHPKLQYPPVEWCPKCHLKGSSNVQPLWNESEVVAYLLNRYTNIKSNDNNRLSRTAQEAAGPDEHSGAEGVKVRSWRKMSLFHFKYFNGLDISLCVVLYMFSGVLLVIVYFIIMLRRRSRKRIFYGFKLP